MCELSIGKNNCGKLHEDPKLIGPLIEFVWPGAHLTSDRIEIMNLQLVLRILIQSTPPVHCVLYPFGLQMQADDSENPQQTIIFSSLILFGVVHYRSTKGYGPSRKATHWF